MNLINPIKKIALITGANRGLGFEVALELAQRNFKVIMADNVNQTASKEKIIFESGNDDVHAYFLNLASFDSIKRFSEQIYQDVEFLDVLINNAGVFCMNKQKTDDCLDAVMQINHLGPFLLTNLMTELLKNSSNGRIIFISSNGIFLNNLTVDQLVEPNYFTPHFISGLIHYYNTKLCNLIACKFYAEKLKKYNIICNSLHPYMINTSFLTSSKKDSLITKLEGQLIKRVIKYVTREAKFGADSVIYLANSDEIENITGKYFTNYQIHREPKIVEDKTFCEKICGESGNIVGLKNVV